MAKLYCYVDESGQDTEGQLYVVGVLHLDSIKRDMIFPELLAAEQKSKKDRRKWSKTDDVKRLAYIRGVFQIPSLKGNLFYELHLSTIKYRVATLETIIKVFVQRGPQLSKAVICIDGLVNADRRWFQVELRDYISVDKVVAANDEGDPFIRLADALCGLVRDAVDGKPEFKKLLDKVVGEGVVIEI